MTRRRLALASLVVLVLAGIALARPGGGESFSGGGGGSSGGGGGGSGFLFFFVELIYYLFVFIIDFPYVSLPVIAVMVIYIVWSSRHKRANRDWNSGAPATLAVPRETSLPRDLAALRAIDPDFSQPVFEDFAFRLFATAQRARANPEALAAVAPYVSEGARVALAGRANAGPVQQVIVGSLRVDNIAMPPRVTDNDRVTIRVVYEANVATAEHTYYSVEQWWFQRAATRHSKPPGATRTFPCPNCGAPWKAAAMGTQVCSNCGQTVDNGRFDWTVDRLTVDSSDELPPTVTQEVPERGTDLPTVMAPDMLEHAAELTKADPNVTEATLEARLATIYTELNKAWSNNELAPARPFVSDALYDYLEYWVDTYKRQTLRNQLTNMRITKAQLAKVERDKWYDAVTMRLWATGIDYVINTDSGRVLRGSKSKERPYSEYWTLIRSAGKQGKPQTTAVCNNCGAPLKINMAGECEHCGAHVTSGEFDWVLSKIEQDDVYRG
jgi:predicted lipid-binding transport protein (Tim44 family)